MEEKYNKDYFQRYPFAKGLRGKLFNKIIKSKGPLFRFLIHYCKKGERLLDLGCGEGYFLSFAEKYFKTWGIDVSSFAITAARKNTKKTVLYEGNCEDLSQFEDNFFDIVTAFDLLEHLKEPQKTIQEINRILKLKGILVISTPNPFSLGRKLKKEKWHGFTDPTHISIKEASEWKEILERNHFTVLKLFYDYFWDPSYTHFLPKFIEELFIKFPTFVLFWLGIGSGKYLGENLWIIAEKEIL
jgi:ubiquinone/menaquinone biosynthesis C-methylase UbiE